MRHTCGMVWPRYSMLLHIINNKKQLHIDASVSTIIHSTMNMNMNNHHADIFVCLFLAHMRIRNTTSIWPNICRWWFWFQRHLPEAVSQMQFMPDDLEYKYTINRWNLFIAFDARISVVNSVNFHHTHEQHKNEVFSFVVDLCRNWSISSEFYVYR